MTSRWMNRGGTKRRKIRGGGGSGKGEGREEEGGTPLTVESAAPALLGEGVPWTGLWGYAKRQALGGQSGTPDA